MQVGPQRLRREDDERVAGVGVGGGEQPAGALNASLPQHGVAGGVGFQQ